MVNSVCVLPISMELTGDANHGRLAPGSSALVQMVGTAESGHKTRAFTAAWR